MQENSLDKKVIKDFGSEWVSYSQGDIPKELEKIFNNYFSLFPWDKINKDSVGFDLGCGSGRWAKFVSPKVKELYCIEPSNAIDVAKLNLEDNKNCNFIKSSVHEMPIENDSMDFGYSLGVLHHITKSQEGLNECTSKLKPGAPFLLYLYYSFENRPFWYRLLWKISNYMRLVTSKFPFPIKLFISKVMAIIVYYPLARLALFASKFIDASNFPLSIYKDKSFYTMQTDALDRFGTRLEKRYTKKETAEMMKKANLENIKFSESEPYWCVIGYKKK
tara:strand:+ start:72 stop:899 length:828 start_codon:yes stop_codon:yes gene_type:complete